MYILLQTHTAWEITGDYSAAPFFRSLPLVVDQADNLSVGAYDAQLFEQLARMENTHHFPHRRPYQPTLNRGDYPNGRAFDFLANAENLEAAARVDWTA